MTAPTLALTRPHPRAAHGRPVPLVTLRSSPCPDSATSITVTNGVPQVGQHLDHPAFESGMRASTSPVTCIDFTCHESGRAAAGFTTRSNTSGDPDSLRILRRSRHRGAAPASRCEARMRLWRRTRQTEMSGFAQGPNVRAGCLAIPSARPASLAIVSAAPASVFHFDAVQAGES